MIAVKRGFGVGNEAEAAGKQALSILERALPAGHAEQSFPILRGREQTSKLQDAEAIHRQVLAMREKTLPPGHPEIAESATRFKTYPQSSPKIVSGRSADTT